MNIYHNTEEKDYAYQQPKKAEKEPSSEEEEPVVSLVDLHVKTTVMSDTLEFTLMKKSEYSSVGSQFNSLSRILPAQDASIYEVLQSQKWLFYRLCSLKDK
jgi:hypothetical protein